MPKSIQLQTKYLHSSNYVTMKNDCEVERSKYREELGLALEKKDWPSAAYFLYLRI